MPVDLFGQLTVDQLRGALRAQAERGDARRDEEWAQSVEFLSGDQRKHTEAELKRRYPARQAQAKGECIHALSIDLASRYVNEAADIYNHQVGRTLVDESGNEQEKPTKQLNAALADVGFDELMHLLERRVCMLDSAVLWPGVKRGELVGQVITPNLIHPVQPVDNLDVDGGDQCDYLGHVVELAKIGKTGEEKQWVFVTPAAHYYYKSSTWSEVGDYQVRPNAALTWEQKQETDDHKGSVAELPLQLLTFWHNERPTGTLLPITDSIAKLNLEVNVQWSVIMDTMMHQGFGLPVLSLLDAAKVPQSISAGPIFALALEAGETATSLTHANDYAGMVNALMSLSQLEMMCRELNPNDFALQRAAPASGFAKLIDSLPKLRARAERVQRYMRMESQLLWPRLCACLVYLGKLDAGARKLKMRVKFGNIEIPYSTDEQQKRDDWDISHGLTTAAEILAKRRGITVDEAEKIIEENKAKKATVGGNGDDQPDDGENPDAVKGMPQTAEQRSATGKSLIARLVSQSRTSGLAVVGGKDK